MTNKTSVAALILSIAALGLAWHGPFQKQDSVTATKSTVFDRVMKTRTIRCAYAAWPPYFVIEPNTKEKSGVNYEIMQEIGRVANLKIEWVEEAGYGTLHDNLTMGREDLFCSGLRQGTSRAQKVEMTDPAFMIPIYPFVRDGDQRFDGNIDAINVSGVTISTIEGSAVDGIVKSGFPLAKRNTLPELAEAVQMLADVAAGKADVVLADEVYVGAYNDKNPDKKLRRVENIRPVKISGSTFGSAKGEWELRDLINAALMELQGDGTIDRILEKHKLIERGILPVAKLYQVSSSITGK